jgi:hypothetical protein
MYVKLYKLHIISSAALAQTLIPICLDHATGVAWRVHSRGTTGDRRKTTWPEPSRSSSAHTNKRSSWPGFAMPSSTPSTREMLGVHPLPTIAAVWRQRRRVIKAATHIHKLRTTARKIGAIAAWGTFMLCGRGPSVGAPTRASLSRISLPRAPTSEGFVYVRIRLLLIVVVLCVGPLRHGPLRRRRARK